MLLKTLDSPDLNRTALGLGCISQISLGKNAFFPSSLNASPSKILDVAQLRLRFFQSEASKSKGNNTFFPQWDLGDTA